ncbi:hypothetical protein OIU84_009239 [Salix udensis]|uniref:Uncharacterized protein n=1 Tax=Salix udensis TaxID=889485 RepID=A0AAD6JR85_9ROSI|nr:hypothetical protein OIU84_009239 [Salix udensis]
MCRLSIDETPTEELMIKEKSSRQCVRSTVLLKNHFLGRNLESLGFKRVMMLTLASPVDDDDGKKIQTCDFSSAQQWRGTDS